jgi:hypothetical protein
VDTNFWLESPEREIPLGRPRCKWKDNTKIELKEIKWEGVD